jgi:hypothetical protein
MADEWSSLFSFPGTILSLSQANIRVADCYQNDNLEVPLRHLTSQRSSDELALLMHLKFKWGVGASDSVFAISPFVEQISDQRGQMRQSTETFSVRYTYCMSNWGGVMGHASAAIWCDAAQQCQSMCACPKLLLIMAHAHSGAPKTEAVVHFAIDCFRIKNILLSLVCGLEFLS